MQIQGNLLEELVFKASDRGFFTEWQDKMSTISKENFLPMHEAGKLAYEELKNK
ncbi:hypothetical protein [Polaribacter ponticola]|uniref:Uncharacterized protein n=1 Tax=Polaribacter ponticola TaxID=2978475 RepID=A0ABT5SBY1_9FLAO|nr:hypothetical protein [Polaribacter sp. MSW5]MDD7915319.1 hypothetical protein [Polaribacter sp. MSW5]